MDVPKGAESGRRGEGGALSPRRRDLTLLALGAPALTSLVTFRTSFSSRKTGAEKGPEAGKFVNKSARDIDKPWIS